MSERRVCVCVRQESDFRHLVLSLWGGQSCLSADPDLYELLLCRWDVDEPWTPWNCVLLTRDETEAHYKLGKPQQVGACHCHVVQTSFLGDGKDHSKRLNPVQALV